MKTTYPRLLVFGRYGVEIPYLNYIPNSPALPYTSENPLTSPKTGIRVKGEFEVLHACTISVWVWTSELFLVLVSVISVLERPDGESSTEDWSLASVSSQSFSVTRLSAITDRPTHAHVGVSVKMASIMDSVSHHPNMYFRCPPFFRKSWEILNRQIVDRLSNFFKKLNDSFKLHLDIGESMQTRNELYTDTVAIILYIMFVCFFSFDFLEFPKVETVNAIYASISHLYIN